MSYFQITTVSNDIDLIDLGLKTIQHPATNFDLVDEYGLTDEEICDSVDLRRIWKKLGLITVNTDIEYTLDTTESTIEIQTLKTQLVQAQSDIGNLSTAGGTIIFGTNFAEENDDSTSTTTSQDFQNKLTLNLSGLVSGGKYRIGWFYNWNFDDTGKNHISEVTLNGMEIASHIKEPKDSGGSFGATGSGQKLVVSGFDYVTINDVTAEIKINWKSGKKKKKASIWNAKLEFWRVS